MGEHRITLIGDEAGLADLRTIAQKVLGCWPGVQTDPELHERAVSDVAGIASTEGEDVDDGSVLLVRVADGTASSSVYKLIDRLRAAMIPALLLVADGSADANLASGGVIARSRSTDPAVLAATLHALCSRQETVEDLSRDLRISVKTHGGVREEIDRISQELSLASKIQQELVPSEMPEVAGVDFGVLYRPAGYVSGDIYNVQRIDDRRVGFFIADAVGHGVPAALLTMIISRSLPMRGGCSGGRLITPSDALARLNDDLCDVSDGNPRFATAVYGILDSEDGVVRIANAGHPPPLRICSEHVGKVDAGGPLLGVFHDAVFPEESFELAKDETLLLYSDGFETAFPNPAVALKKSQPSPTMKYLEHLVPIGRWRQRGSETLGGAFRKLEEALDNAHGSLHQADDVTALAMSRRAA